MYGPHPSTAVTAPPVVSRRPVNVVPTMATKGEQPYSKNHDFNAAVWISRQTKEPKQLLGRQPLMRQLMETPSLQPGEIHMAIINIAPVGIHREARLRHQSVGEIRDVQRQRVRLAVTEPGEYVLEAVWKPEGLATGFDRQRRKLASPWRGTQIDFPPIKVRILEEEKQNDKR